VIMEIMVIFQNRTSLMVWRRFSPALRRKVSGQPRGLEHGLNWPFMPIIWNEDTPYPGCRNREL
jgi:hypothetical protein